MPDVTGRHRLLTVALAATLSAALSASALAAQPEPGKAYKGFTSGPTFNGYRPPISFKVGAAGKSLRHFKYAGRCDGIGGIGGNGDPWVNALFVIKVGTIPVTSKGRFSVKNVKWTADEFGTPKTTTSTVTGHFKTAAKAVGSIKFTQTEKNSSATCTWTFTARAS